ncbi:DUF2797 domain-containing protein [Salinimicrobium tongyeongense]|uniref:DUF2797 domain-containing protein n=1 Tax=Salinimicrobium tongyeongense TaxID=2809707 RepID=A0ABY6NTG0_9FLAO|nr:DUF2797 domain-containing protein [Salinimicrobium tongyeongense]UZH56205.1 DUF2797 domain-containing protein [Salinimicrobium tongyeongense]
MTYEGVLKKMKTELAETVQYYLIFEQDFLNVNQVLDKRIAINFLNYECLGCGKKKKVFANGVCYNCFMELPEMGEWVIRPELSKAHLDQEHRDLEFEKRVQLQPHVVYLANSSNVKVGVTRKTEIPTRWIDQGAHEAIEVVEVPNRYLAGITEVALKEHLSDKTNWRSMLTNDLKDLDLAAIRDNMRQYLPEEVQDYYLANSTELEIKFPVLDYPAKCKSLNLAKTSFYEGVLKGIKGQYLIFEDGMVFNVRKHEGFNVNLSLK